ncbi:MAG TPA: GGDEF domain-containing protein [Nocardioides sp.]|nr:GGDEF domain-containing protein [Nocardioides sp.]
MLRPTFMSIPAACRLWVTVAVLAAVVLPVLLAPYGHARRSTLDGTILVLVGLSVLNVELGRLFEGGISNSQRPHKALSAWSFGVALLLPTWWLAPVVAVVYAHARWRGLRVQLWKWIGSAGYLVLAGLAAAVTAQAVGGPEPASMSGGGFRGMLAVLAAASVFLAVETLLFHGSAYLNRAVDEEWLRTTLCTRSFYFTETGVLLVGGLSASIWTSAPWFLALLLPVWALAQLAALHEPLRLRADRDELTGLLRYEPWRRLAGLDAARCRARGRPWSVLFADLDHFKLVNDRHGHLAGDQALSATAHAIRAAVRDVDLVGRFGGEEFCVLLPETGPDEAARAAERIRVAVEALRMPGAGRVTVSVGAASVPGASEVALIDALTTADRSLACAKANGRNRVEHQAVLAARV